MRTATGRLLPSPIDHQWHPLRSPTESFLRRRGRRSKRLAAQHSVPVQYELFGSAPEPEGRPIGPVLIATIVMLALFSGSMGLLAVLVEFVAGWSV